MLNLNNNNSRWIKKEPQTNDAAMNSTEILDDNLQEYKASKAFYSLKEKFNRNSSIQNDDTNDKSTWKNWPNRKNQPTSYPIEESRKSDFSALESRRHITDTNSLEHFNMHPTGTLNICNNNHSNSLMNDSNPINDISKSFTEPIVPSNRSTLERNVCISESWREINHVDKIKNTALLFNTNSLTNEIMPFVSLQALANPYLQIPIEVCRMAKNINLKVAEVLCRKRTEVSVISWMAIKLNQ